MRKFAVLVVILAFAGGSCRSEPEVKKETPADKPVRSVVNRQLTLTMSGSITFKFAGKHTMQFHSFIPKTEGLSGASVATASTRTPLEYEPGLGVIVGVSIVGNYTGAGSYKIYKRDFGSPKPGQPPPSLSIIRIETYDMTKTPPVFIERIDVDELPCSVIVSDHARKGSAKCPLITNDQGKRVKLDIRWDQLKPS